MSHSAEHLTVAQFDLLRWVADGCKEGVYQNTSYRVSARALHNRGLLSVAGNGKSWTASITPEGCRRLDEEAKRIEAQREAQRREEQARADREREKARLRERAMEVLEAVLAAGGRLDLGGGKTNREIAEIEACLAREGLLPEGQRLVHEPTRMDPDLGVTAYLEPDFAAITRARDFNVPRQLRDPHPAVVAFQNKRACVSKPQIARAARFLQAIASAAVEIGWKVSAHVPHMNIGHDKMRPDLALRLPSREVVVSIRELDQRGRRVSAFTTGMDYYTREQRTTANKHFLASGKLEVSVIKAWDDQPILTLRDTDAATLEEQLPTLIRTLEIAEAEACWAREEESRRAEIRKVRWEEVKKRAFTELTYERNAERLRDELARRDAAAAMREYADEIDARATQLDDEAVAAAREWSGWIRDHAERTDPKNGPLHLVQVSSARHDELQPHMKGWSTHGPYRQ